jgi:CRP/FNR family cyclic AMP-dependent transcriptional regulator
MANYPQSPTIRRLFSKGQPITYPKGEVIIGNDEEPDGVYYIHTGYVKIYSVSDDGDEYIHIILGPGELFPLIWAYINVQASSLFSETISEVVTWRISREWFNTFAKSDLELSYAMGQQIARQYQAYSDRVDNLEYKKASERVIYRLLFLASRFGSWDKRRYLTIQAPLTHELFANTINLARESVSREFEKLEADDLIVQEGHNIHIMDVKALAGRLSQPVGLGDWHIMQNVT